MNKQKDEMALWAEKVARGIDDSSVFLQLFNPKMSQPGADPLDDPAYLLQLGYAVMLDKPIAVLAAYGDEVPEKLQAIADVVEYYDRGSMKSMGEATERAVRKLTEDDQSNTE